MQHAVQQVTKVSRLVRTGLSMSEHTNFMIAYHTKPLAVVGIWNDGYSIWQTAKLNFGLFGLRFAIVMEKYLTFATVMSK